MNYKEFTEIVRNVPPPAGLALKQAYHVYWCHMETLPLDVISLGEGASGVIVIPGQAENRFGRVVPVIGIKSAFEGQREVTDVVLPSSIWCLPQGAFAG